MRSLVTSGWICLQDDYQFVYKVARIDYTEWEDGHFLYSFYPFYSVIDMLPPHLFQGIPGLDLSLRRACYERENRVPVFISERTPAENREDLWELLEENGMDALNRLEWLIKTNTRYSGDRFFIEPITGNDKVENKIESMYMLARTQDKVIEKILQIICFGDDLYCKELNICDRNRAEFYNLFMSMYVREYETKKAARIAGIQRAKEANGYRGRAQKALDPLLFDQIAEAYLSHRITASEATERLGISRATFFRRIKEIYRQ